MTEPTGQDDSPSLPSHRRSVVFDAYDLPGDAVLVVGRLRDERPWATRPADLPVIHDLELRVAVSLADLTVQEVTTCFHTYPHAECPGIADAYRSLVGVAVGRGWTTALRDRLGGPAGCTHLRELARAMGPVVLQAVFSSRTRAGYTRDPRAEDSAVVLTLLRDTCHVWAAGGIGEQKLARGWRPGTTTYPVPPLSDFEQEPAAQSGKGFVDPESID